MFNARKSIDSSSLLTNILIAGSVLLCMAGNALADLEITKTIDPIISTPAADGDVIRYNLSVTNTGAGPLANVIINDVPNNLNNVNFTVTSASPPSNSPGPGANQYTFDTLPAGETVTLNANTNVNAVDACPVIENSASVSEASGTFTDSATAPDIEYDFELTSGATSNVIRHVIGSSFCEFCTTGEVHITITNPTTAAMNNIVLQEDLQALGLTYINGSTTSSIGGASNPAILWYCVDLGLQHEIGALASLARWRLL